MLRNFASLQSYSQKLLNSVLKDVFELSILSIPRETPLSPPKNRKKNKQGKERKGITYTQKKGRVRLFTSPEVV